MKKAFLTIFFIFLIIQTAHALSPEPDAVFVRVIDVGPGESCVIKMPGDFYMVYDAGHWNGQGKSAFEGISEIVPDGEEIDLMILSHSDSDHIGAVKRVFDKYTVKKVIRTGLERDTNTWKRSNETIRTAHRAGTTRDINLKWYEFPVGATYRFGDTFVTFVSGFYAPPDEWGLGVRSHKAEFRNAGSVVIRLQYKGKSILFTGDAVGRHIDDPDDAIIAAEKFMVDNSEVINIDSTVLIAPHHGADNGSSNAFINAVSPEWVIFTAGHAHRHPRAVAAQRYLDSGVEIDKMFRTDLGDDEGVKEWDHGRIPGHKDKSRDDDVDILIRASGEVVVGYRN